MSFSAGISAHSWVMACVLVLMQRFSLFVPFLSSFPFWLDPQFSFFSSEEGSTFVSVCGLFLACFCLPYEGPDGCVERQSNTFPFSLTWEQVRGRGGENSDLLAASIEDVSWGVPLCSICRHQQTLTLFQEPRNESASQPLTN